MNVRPCALLNSSAASSPQARSDDASDGHSNISDQTLVDSCWSQEPLPFSATGPSKLKYLPPCEHLGVPSTVRISCVTNDGGRHFLMGSKQAKGAWGKFKPLLPIDSPTQNLCVKESRLPRPGPLVDWAEHCTCTSELRNVRREAFFSHQFGGRFAAQQLFVWEQRAFLILPMAHDNLWHLVQGLSDQQRAVVARSVVIDGAKALSRMHDAGYVHRDVSIGNFLVDAKSAKFVLSDFGATVRVEDLLFKQDPGVYSSHCAPEVLIDSRDISELTDVWSLAATALNILQPQDRERPYFLSYVKNEQGSVDRKKTKKMIDLFFDAATGKVTTKTKPIIEYIHVCKTVDHDLTTLLVLIALVKKNERCSMQTLRHMVKGLDPLGHTPEPRQVLKEIIASSPSPFLDNDTYRALNAVRLHEHARLQINQVNAA